MIIEVSEEALRHWCRLYLPGVNDVLTLDHLDCAIHSLSNEKCPLCEEFQQAVRDAITKEAGRRLKGWVNE